jgi:hypothetical protein
LIITETALISNEVLSVRHKGLLYLIEHRNHASWLRIFSLSIFYNFSLAYYNLTTAAGWLASVVVKYGHYFITVLLVMQLVSILILLLRRSLT